MQADPNSKRRKIGARLAVLKRTRRSLAESLGLSEKNLSRWFGDATSISRDLRMAAALGVSPMWLIDSDVDMLSELTREERRVTWSLCWTAIAWRLDLKEIAARVAVHQDELLWLNASSPSSLLLAVCKTAEVSLCEVFSMEESG